MNKLTCYVSGVVLGLGVLTGPAIGQPVADFENAITRAVLENPRVQASWYNFEAAREAETGVRGGYLPSVDLIGEYGREDRETSFRDFGSYDRDSIRLTITQMLFDGFYTVNEARRAGYTKLSQYYQLQRDSQAIALEAAEAYLDTVRFQQLVKYAEENYVVHRQVFDKIEERAEGGVSQGVDLDQAAARLALAESNLLTEMTNLHDVQTRFQRVVGSLPADDLPMPNVPDEMIPEYRLVALEQAYEMSPEIDAAIENVLAAQSALDTTSSPMMPRLDLRYRNEYEHNTNGPDVDGSRLHEDLEAIELVLTYNLFRGGADSARKREYHNQYNAAIEERKQACLNVRQEVMIAFNDVRALHQQVAYLETNRLSQDKTRRAYFDQFDIGQRTLLDLLDSQNEYFDTQRAHVSALSDLRAAQARTLASSGLLLAALSMDGLNADKLASLDLARDPDDENAQARCPLDAPEPVIVDKEALLAGLMAKSDRYRDVGDNKVALELLVTFALNSSIITSNFDEEIANAARFLRDNPGVRAVVEGHTCSLGEDVYNQWLSDRRANAVRKMLIDKHGVNPAQITSVGYGETRPVSDNDTREGREQNRRVELILDANGA